MKDAEVRFVINLLNKRIKQLNHELWLLKQKPHSKECRCSDCLGRRADYFFISPDRLHGYFEWFEDK